MGCAWRLTHSDRRPWRQLALACALALALIGAELLPTNAAASGLSVALHITGDARVGEVNLITAVVESAPYARCELRVSAGERTKTLRSGLLGSVVWHRTEPVDAPKGTWTFLATCRGGSYYAWRRYEAEMAFPERGGALVATPLPGTPGSAADGQVCDAQGLCFAPDPNPVGQCTWYALGRRPDLLGIVHGNAWEWLGAAAGRVPEGSRPAVGAIAVWAQNTPGVSGVDGHVAYVAAISGSRILIDDSNWRPTPWSPPLEVHEHWEATSSVAGYIYGGPAGDGP